MNAEQSWNQSIARQAVIASLGGTAVAGGASTTASVVIPGASSIAKQNTNYANSVGAVATCSPAFAGGPGAGFVWMAYIDDASVTDQVTVRLTNVTAGSLTPVAGAYAVQLLIF